MEKSKLEELEQRIAVLENIILGNKSKPQKTVGVDFTLNERTFVKRYATGLTAPEKFVLLVCYMAKGKLGVEVDVSKVAQLWNKMKSSDLMGVAFNSKYPTVAKTEGWVDSKTMGKYELTTDWTNIFTKTS